MYLLLQDPNIIRALYQLQFFIYTSAGCKPLLVNFTDLTIPDGTSRNKLGMEFGDGISQILYCSLPIFMILPPILMHNLAVTDSYGCSNSFTTLAQVFVTDPSYFSADTLPVQVKL